MAQFVTHIQPTLVEASHGHHPGHHHHKQDAHHKDGHGSKDSPGHQKDSPSGGGGHHIKEHSRSHSKDSPQKHHSEEISSILIHSAETTKTKPQPPQYIDLHPVHKENKSSDGNTSFLRAARAGHLEKVLEHLRSNIDINTSNANGLNALHLASKDGHVNVVSELLKRGAIVDSATKKGNTALHIASLAGQEEVVKLLVQHGAAVNVQSQNGFTPLYMAAQENHDSVVKYLLANGANQSLATEDGFTPLAVAMQQGHDKVVAVLLENDTRGKVRLPALHIAAKKDDVKAAKLLLENEHNPDVTSKSGFTPLHIASHYGNEAIANLLIQKGADVNYAAKHNITPLHVAAKWGKTNMVALLLEKGANIESKTRDGLTPLHCAARSGHEQVVDMLLEKGAPISSKTKNGLAPLHMAAQGEHVEAARILLYHRAPVDEVTVDYLTALHVAAHCGHVRVAKLLLDRQADANARALNGFTPLHIACKKNRIKVVELLLKHGASISATTESGLTPLHVASFMGCMNIVIYLLQHEANPDVPTIRGETPLHLAARANQTDIIRILLRNGAQVDARAREQQTPLHIASRLGNVDIVMLLLQHGAQVDVTTKDMYTALHIAAKEGQDEVASVLLENNASLNATTKKGFTPLHLAAKYGNMKVAKLLLQREAAVDAQGKNGVTPLHVASHYDHQNVALLLLDKGASPHATAKNGHTPLHIAARKNQMDIATTLLEYGAKANAESKSGFTPLHLSSQEGHLDMSSLLIEHKADTNHHAKNGLTPMHLCAQEDRVNVAQVLLKNGAQVDAQTKAGYTPLHVAAHFGQANMVRFLLQNGANVNTTTGIDYTPLHQAAQQGHTHIVNILLENGANPNAITNNGQTAHNIAQKLGYITVMETLKQVTDPTATQAVISEEKYRVVAPEAMHETFMSDSEEEGGDYSGEDTMLSDQPYRYLTVDEMKSLGDDSLPIDVTRDELRIDSNRMVVSGDQNMLPPQAMDDAISPQHINQNYSEYTANKYMPDNIDIKHPINIGKLHWKNFLVSFLVDARGGAMRGCRHSGVRVIVPPRCAGMPTRITCRYVKPQRTPHPPPLMEGEALASRVLELGPVGAKFLGPVIIEVPHFAALRGKEREIVILRSDNGETWREHVIEASEDIVQDVLNESFEAEDLSQLEDISSGRITRILTHDFPQYFAVVSRIRQEVHAIGPEGGMVSSSVVPQVQAVFPQGALTKKIKVGLQAQPIDPDLTAKLLGHGVAVSPVVTVEPRRRKFHKAITLSMPAPRAHTQGMINQYSGSAPTLRLLCSITGGTTRAQWEDVTGSTPLTFVNDCVSFTTTVSARFWLMDCRNIGDATKMATELYREAIHVPFMAKFVVFAKRVDTLEARLRVFCMTDDREDKTLEHQEHFTEVAKSRDVEVLEGKPQYIEFAGNLVPVTKSGDQLQFAFRAFRENRLPFTVRVKDQHADTVGRCLFMREPKVAKGEPPQQPICVLNIVLPDNIVVESYPVTETEMLKKYGFIKEGLDVYPRTELRLSDMSNLLGEDWPALASELGLSTSQINVIKSECPDSLPQQAQSMLRLWRVQSGNKAQGNTLELALKRIGRSDIIAQCLNIDVLDQAVARAGKDQGGFDSLKDELGPSRDASLRRNISLDNTYDEQDIMKDSESIESLIQERKDSYEIDSRLRNISERDEMKYTAEEKEVQEEESGVDDAEIKKSVAERRIEIEKRLSSDREIPPSLQKHEIVQEISTIKRQSLIDDKIKYNENIIEEHVKEKVPDKVKDKDLDTEKVTKVTTTKTIVTTVDSTRKSPPKITEKTVKETITVQGKKIIPDDDIVDNELKEKLAAQKQKIELDDTKPSETTTTITKTTIVTHKVSDVDDTRRDSTLFEDVSHELERLDTTAKPQPPASEDIKSPKISKTPPPSPAEFLREQAVSENQEWSPASAAEIEKRYAATTGEIDKKTQPEEIGQTVTELTTCVPKPKPRATKSTENQIEQLDLTGVTAVQENEEIIEKTDVSLESYSERKKFWEQVSTSQDERAAMKDNLSTIIHDQNPPIPKPRSSVHASSRNGTESIFYKTDGKSDTDVESTIHAGQSSTETTIETDNYKPVSEYMASFQHPFLTSEKPIEILKSDDTTYTSDDTYSTETKSDFLPDKSSILTQKSYKHFVKDLSMDQPPKVAQRKTIFERSTSLPTEDLHISELSIKERKSFFEQQIKKEMIVEQLMTQPEDELTPEYKAIERCELDSEKLTQKEKSQSSTLPYSSSGEQVEHKLLSDSESLSQEQKLLDLAQTQKSIEKRSSTESEQSISSERSVEIELDENTKEHLNEVLMHKSESNSRPSDSLEVHVDKSELEDSEKINDYDVTDVTDLENKSEWDSKSETSANNLIEDDKESSKVPAPAHEAQTIHVSEEQIPDTIWEVPLQSEISSTEVTEIVSDIKLSKAEEIHESKFEIAEKSDSEVSKINEIHDFKRQLQKTDVSETIDIHETQVSKKYEVDDTHIDHYESKIHEVLERKDFKSDEIYDSKLESAKIVEEDGENKTKETAQIVAQEVREVAEEIVNKLEETIQGTQLDLQALKREPPAPDPEIAQNQVSEYLRQLAEAKGLDEREVELVESVLARKQRELSRITRTDTQTSSLEITDEDLRCSGAETDVSPADSQALPMEVEPVKVKPDLSALNKTLAEVQESLHAAQEELIERGIHKKPSPSEFQFKDISQVKLTDEEIQLMQDKGISSDIYKQNFNIVVKKEECLTNIYEQPSEEHNIELEEEIVSLKSEQSGITLDDKAVGQLPTTSLPTRKIGIRSSSEDSTVEESIKSPEEQSASSSGRKDDSETSYVDTREVVLLRKTRKHKEQDSSGIAIKIDRRSGADFEGWSSSGESHYQSFELDSSKSRPCSSDIEGLLAAGSSEYESALTSQCISSKSHLTSAEYHTAVSSLSSRESMKSLDSESSGHLASVEVSEASETLIPSTMEMDGDILDEQSALDDEDYEMVMKNIADLKPDIPHDTPIKDEKIKTEDRSRFSVRMETQESEETIGEDESTNSQVLGESKMKRSHEMTFQPEPKILTSTESPLSETAETFDDKYGSSLEEGSVLSVSYSSTSDVSVARTVIECSEAEGDVTESYNQLSNSLLELGSSVLTDDKVLMSESATCTAPAIHDYSDSVTMTTSYIEDSGIQSVSTQVSTQSEKARTIQQNGPVQADYTPELDEPKRRGHRRNESTFTFKPSMIPKMLPATDLFESQFESEVELTTKEVYNDEKKDIDETEKVDFDERIAQEFDKQFEQENEIDYNDYKPERPHSQVSKSDSESHRAMSVAFSDDRPDSELAELLKQYSSEATSDPIERPASPEPTDVFEKSDSPETHVSGRESELEFSSPYPRSPDYHTTINLEFESLKTEKSDEETGQKYTKDQTTKDFPEKDIGDRSRLVSSSSEKSSFEEAEADAVFHMVPHISPAHQAKPISTIPEDEDAEKQETEMNLLSEKLLREEHQILMDQSPGSIPDIMVTEHMTPLMDKGFRYPDLEIQEQEREEELLKSTPQTPASISSKSSEETDQGREYVIDDSENAIQEESEVEICDDRATTTESKSDISGTVEDKTVYDAEEKEPSSHTDSPTSDSFEILDKPDITDDFVVIEEIGKEANEGDVEGKSVAIKSQPKYIRKVDEEVEAYLVKSAPAKMTGLKYYPDSAGHDELGPFEFEDSPPTAGTESTASKTRKDYEYDSELEASKKWIEMQFQGDQSSMVNVGYGYEMEFERAPLEDIKEEEIADFDPSSRIGSLNSQKESGGSFSSVKDSFSSTPEYDVLAGRKFFTRSGEHDDVSMSSLQEFENLEQAISLENRRFHHGSQDSLSNGSFTKRYHISRSGQGDDVSLSSLKEFEGLESACIQAHKIEVIAKEEEAMLAQIDEGHENTISESDSLVTSSTTQKKIVGDSDEEDYEKRMFEIDEIIRQAQSNVEQFIDLKLAEDKTQSLGRGDSIEEVAKIPDLDLDVPTSKISTISSLQSQVEDVGLTSTDSLEVGKSGFHASTDSLDLKTAGDIMTASTDSIEFQAQSKIVSKDVMTDSIEVQEVHDSSLIASDSLELGPNAIAQTIQTVTSPSERGSTPSYKSRNGNDFEADTNIQDQCSDIMLGSTDSLEPTSSTATHATYHFETDSVLSSSFTSGGSNTMVSSTDTIDPNGGGAQAMEGIDLAAAIKQVWSDENSYADSGETKTSYDYKESGSKPFVTEVIEPCEEDGFSLTIHRMVDLPPEIQRVTFKGADAEQQYQKYIEKFGEGQFVQETEHTDTDGNVHVQKVIQNRVIMKDLSTDRIQNMSEAELQAYVQQKINQQKYTTTFSTDEHTAGSYPKKSEDNLDKDFEHLMTSISGTTTKLEGPQTEIVAHRTYVTRHVTPTIIDIQGTETEQLEQDEAAGVEETEELKDEAESQTTSTRPKPAGSQHDLSEEMKALLAEMEEQSKR